MKNLARILLVGAPLCLAIAGCDDKSKTAPPEKTDKVEKNAKTDKTDEAKPTGGTAGGTTKKDDGEALELVERDLAERGAEWKGIAVDGPKDAKIWDDMGNCRVVTKKFDLVLSQKKDMTTIAGRKKSLEETAKMIKGKVTFDNETADTLEYTMESPGFGEDKKMFASKKWFMTVKVGKKDIGCMPHDAADKETYDTLKKACATVREAK